MRLFGQTFTAGILERIRGLIANEAGLSRSALSRQVCDWLDWRGANGRVQEVSSRKALGELARRGLIELPPVRGCPPRGCPAAADLPCHPQLPKDGGSLDALSGLPQPSRDDAGALKLCLSRRITRPQLE